MENRILRQQLTGRVQLTDAERKSLAEVGKKLGKQVLKEVATIVKPDTILGWHRTLVAQKSDDSRQGSVARMAGNLLQQVIRCRPSVIGDRL
jgi:hypothetical protein